MSSGKHQCYKSMLHIFAVFPFLQMTSTELALNFKDSKTV